MTSSELAKVNVRQGASALVSILVSRLALALILVLMFVGLPRGAARDVCHICLLSTTGPEFSHYCSALLEHVPASFVPTWRIVRNLASEAS